MQALSKTTRRLSIFWRLSCLDKGHARSATILPVVQACVPLPLPPLPPPATMLTLSTDSQTPCSECKHRYGRDSGSSVEGSTLKEMMHSAASCCWFLLCHIGHLSAGSDFLLVWIQPMDFWMMNPMLQHQFWPLVASGMLIQGRAIISTSGRLL